MWLIGPERGGKGGGGRRVNNRGWSARSDPQRPKRPSATSKTSGDLASAIKQLVYFATNGCFDNSADQSHNDDVRRTTAEEQLKQKAVQLSEPISTSLYFISPGLS